MTSNTELIELDVSAVKSVGELHDLLANRLGFPTFYGRNWDAFWDCVTDAGLSGLPQKLVVKGLPTLSLEMPVQAEAFVRCLREMQPLRPDCAVYFQDVSR